MVIGLSLVSLPCTYKKKLGKLPPPPPVIKKQAFSDQKYVYVDRVDLLSISHTVEDLGFNSACSKKKYEKLKRSKSILGAFQDPLLCSSTFDTLFD
jgi:hypothetical protein